MNKKKIFKRLLISTFVITAIGSLVIGGLLHFIFTPAKITPKVLAILNEQLTAEVHCDAVELTFFSTFPKVGLALKNTVIQTSKTGQLSDTLLSFEKATLTFNAYKYWKKKEVDVNRLTIKRPKVYVYLDDQGKGNWDILKAEPSDTLPSDTLSISNFTINKVALEKGVVIFEDKITKITHTFNDFDVFLRAKNNDASISFTLDLSGKDVAVFYKDIRVYDLQTPMAEINMEYDKLLKTLTFEAPKVAVNNIEFNTSGRLMGIPEAQKLRVDLHSELRTNSIAGIVKLIPPNILNTKGIQARGAITGALDINGFLGVTERPVFTGFLEVKDGAIGFQDFPGTIDDLHLRASTEIYPETLEASIVNIETVVVKGTGINIAGSGLISGDLTLPKVEANLLGTINCTELYKKFPWDASINAQGTIACDLKANFQMADVLKEHYDKINTSGNFQINDFYISSVKDSILFKTQKIAGAFNRSIGKTKMTGAQLSLDDVQVDYKKLLNLSIKNALFQGYTVRDKNQSATLQFKATISDTYAASKWYDWKGIIRNVSIDGDILHENDAALSIKSKFTIDSIGGLYQQYKGGLEKGNYRVAFRRSASQQWFTEGVISFAKMKLWSPISTLPMEVPGTTITFKDDDLTLQKAQIIFGDTDVVLTGNIRKAKGFETGKPVYANLHLSSSFLNVNQLINVLSPTLSQSDLKGGTIPQDTLKLSDNKSHSFGVPTNLHFEFTTDIKSLQLGNGEYTDIKGALNIADGQLKLDHFKLNTIAGKLDANVMYSAQNTKAPFVDFKLYLKEVELDKLHKLLPQLDSIFPVTKAFVGKADFRIKGTTQLDQNLAVNMKTTKAIAGIKATNIMILDGPTFTELAKTFMFKNKKVNPVDFLELEMELKHNDLEIFPALLEIDRYRLAVGGVQHLDMSYMYHISVLKSPVPFKTGVDITGDSFDDYDIDITKAKYKYYFTDKERLLKKADSTLIKRRDFIRNELEFQN